MKIEIVGNQCIVTREEGDPRFYGVKNAAGESALFHHMVKLLKAQGYDVIKKRMWKDGHMVDEQQQYIRTRATKPNKKTPRVFCIYNTFWAIRGADAALMEHGTVTLGVVDLNVSDDKS
jgi:hypothetical protein